MLIIWGTRRSVQRLAVVMLSCPQGHPAAHTVLKAVTKFTLFFVPLFPVRTRYVVQCTLCGMSGGVDKGNAEQLVASAQQQAAAQQGPYQQGPYQQGPYQQGPHQQAPPGQAPHQQIPPQQPGPWGRP